MPWNDAARAAALLARQAHAHAHNPANHPTQQVEQVVHHTDMDAWYKDIFAHHPRARLSEERIKSGGYAKTAFVKYSMVGKFSVPSGGQRSGYVVKK
jgi:hypothetical protein